MINTGMKCIKIPVKFFLYIWSVLCFPCLKMYTHCYFSRKYLSASAHEVLSYFGRTLIPYIYTCTTINFKALAGDPVFVSYSVPMSVAIRTGRHSS